MKPSYELPVRPLGRTSVADRVRTWVVWFGPARLVVSGLSIVAVIAGATLLLKTPAVPVESTLPRASGSGGATTTVAGSTVPPTSGATAVVPSPTVVSAGVVVHVAGAVVNPGVYTLRVGARVVDALAAAGGAAADAQPDAVNLAAPLVDGVRVYVPRQGEPVPATAVVGPVSSGAPAGPIDLNGATVDLLDTLPGVGPATAAAIVAYRTDHGPFASVDDLAKVRGIGPAKLEAIRSMVTT